MGPPKQSKHAIAVSVRCSARLGLRIVLFVFKTFARFRMMHTREPTKPKVIAIMSLTSTSQRPEPSHQFAVSSVGQMRALIKFMRLESMTQPTRLDAARLRLLMCQAKGGISIMKAVSARTGIATAAGKTGKFASAMIRDM